MLLHGLIMAAMTVLILVSCSCHFFLARMTDLRRRCLEWLKCCA